MKKAEVDAFYDVEQELLAECVKAFARQRYQRRMSFGKVTHEYKFHDQEARMRVLRYLRDRFIGQDVPL